MIILVVSGLCLFQERTCCVSRQHVHFLEGCLSCLDHISLRLEFTCFRQLRCESFLLCPLVFLVILAEDVLKREQFKLPLIDVMEHAWDRYLGYHWLVLRRVQV